MILYLVALFLSPLAVWLCGRRQQAWLNMVLWALSLVLASSGFITAVLVPVVDALFIVYGYYSENRVPVRPVAGRSLGEIRSGLPRGIVAVADGGIAGRRVVA